MILNWAEDALRESMGADSPEKLFKEILHAAQALGFDYCAYGMRFTPPISRPKYFLINNYPPAWSARYMAMGYVEQDPAVIHGARSHQPLVWSDQVFASTPQFWTEAREMGLRVGWSQASPLCNGVAGMLSLSRSGDPLSKSELNEKNLRMRWLASVAHIGFQRHVDAKSIICPHVMSLTEREKEVLRWSAVGKTIRDISEILCISVDTVRFHTRNVLEKLGVSNRTAAVARAVYLGMLD